MIDASTPIDLPALIGRLRALAEEATAGPWQAEAWRGFDTHYRIDATWGPSVHVARTHGDSYGDRRDADYIAAVSPDVVKQLLDALEAALAVMEPMASLVDDWERHTNYDGGHSLSDEMRINARFGDLRAVRDWRNGIIKERKP